MTNIYPKAIIKQIWLQKNSFNQKLYTRKRSPYVDILGKRSERSSFSKIRESAYKHAIQSSRYNATLRNESYCNACKICVIEDETFFFNVKPILN